MNTITEKLDLQRQLGYFSYCLRKLPSAYGKSDTNRLTLVHFAVHSLELLGVWQNEELQQQLQLDRKAVIEWIYALQVVTNEDGSNEANVGFKGGTFLGGTFGRSNDTTEQSTMTTTPAPAQYDHGHIAMTYTALCTLKALGDDLSRLDKEGIIRAMPHLQRNDGSFQCIAVGSEHDMRFLYCAACISYMLNDWSGFDKDRACQYIRDCKSFDGGLALIPGQEGHGGSTFTGIASLVLMGRLEDVLDPEWKDSLIYWCVARQVGGMQGRPNKAEDTCYSYWIGGTLRLLQHSNADTSAGGAASAADSFLDHGALTKFVFECQTQMGGFSKVIGAFPDVLHSFYSLAYLSLSQDHYRSLIQQQSNDRGVLQSLNSTLGIGANTAASFVPEVP